MKGLWVQVPPGMPSVLSSCPREKSCWESLLVSDSRSCGRESVVVSRYLGETYCNDPHINRNECECGNPRDSTWASITDWLCIRDTWHARNSIQIDFEMDHVSYYSTNLYRLSMSPFLGLMGAYEKNINRYYSKYHLIFSIPAFFSSILSATQFSSACNHFSALPHLVVWTGQHMARPWASACTVVSTIPWF